MKVTRRISTCYTQTTHCKLHTFTTTTSYYKISRLLWDYIEKMIEYDK